VSPLEPDDAGARELRQERAEDVAQQSREPGAGQGPPGAARELAARSGIAPFMAPELGTP
jgi:hypothetical protein